MKTLRTLIDCGELSLDTPVAGHPILAEDGTLVFDGARFFKATHRGVVVVEACIAEAEPASENSTPSDFARCYTDRAAAVAAVPEVIEARRAAEARISSALASRVAKPG